MNNLKQVLRLLGVLTFAFVFFGTVSGSAQAALTFSATDIASDGAFTLTFEGATANAFEVTLTSVDPGADATITLPAQTGTVLLSTAAQTAAGSITGVANGFEFEGATDNGFETTLTVTDPTADRTITFPNETGTVVTTGSANVVTGMITDATILAADFAAGAVDTAAILDGTILTGDIAADTILAADIATGAVATAEILDATILAADFAAGAVDTAAILNGTILAADFAAGAVDTAAILDGTILTGDIAADTIAAVDIATGAVATAEILDATILAADFAAGAVDTAAILNGTILAADFAAGAVDTAAILDATILTGDIAADTILAGNIATGAVATAEILDATVASVDMSAGAKTHTVVIPVPDPGAANADITAGYVLWTPSVAVTITKVYTAAETAWVAAAAANDASVVVTNAAVGAVATLAVVTNLAVGSNTDMGAITNAAVVAGTNVTIAVTTNGTADAPRQNIQIEYTTTN